MTGRRILDVAAVFKAGRGVAVKHVAFRTHQLGVYSKTSALAKAVQSQTERVTLTLKAASALVDRFNGPAPQHPTPASRSDTAFGDPPIPNEVGVRGTLGVTKEAEGNGQDHFYERSERNTTAEPLVADGLNVEQGEAKSHPLSDGSVPSRKTVLGGSEVEREALSKNAKTVTKPSDEEKQRPGPSALPTLKVPEKTRDAHQDHERVAIQQMGQDVPCSSDSNDQEQAVPEGQAVPEQNQLSDGAYSEIFHSPRVARMLGGQSKKGAPSKGLERSGAEDTPLKESKCLQESDYVSSRIRTPTPCKQGASSSLVESPGTTAADERGQNDVHALAADMAKDAEKIPSEASEVTNDLQNGPSKSRYEMRESRVPSSRFGRIWQYGGLAASMTFGAVGESFRRATGGGGNAGGSLMLSAGNMERLVAKLSRMRGAALKLGQMMSFQDSKMLPGPINEILQRVQDSADYMPASQRNKVLASNLGADWRNLFSKFDEKPIAAASIGQVHNAILKSHKQRVAVKVQYPGVANSIDSDLSNLSILLTASRLLPKGLYLDKTIANARTELAWECDYIREAEMGERFRQLLADETDIFRVPAIIKEASSAQVLTAEFCSGIGVTKVQNCTQEQKDWIGTNILRLCLREITEFKFMQTDPNWTNFLFNAETNKLELLDFGASRDFPDRFIEPYIRILLAASRSDRATVRDLSIQLGYLTGHESQAMLNAHVSSVLTLAEPFAETAPEIYDFRDQTITDRVRGFIPVMMRERLAPPPEETYSLHRKLSGAFLLCARLGSRIRCREMFRNAMKKAGVD